MTNDTTQAQQDLALMEPDSAFGSVRSRPFARGGERLTAKDILARARVAVPLLREQGVEIECARHLPPAVVDILRQTGVFRMAMPRAWDGPEMDPMQQTEVIEELATGDASAAWCAMIGCDSGFYSGYLDEERAREMFPRLDMVTAGWLAPEGKAERVSGGFTISGRWRFASGCTHSDWMVAGCIVHSGGVPEPSTGPLPVHWRIMLARPEQFRIEDTWFTTGLAGSGSCDYVATELFIPESHSFLFSEPRRPGPLYQAPDAVLRKMAGVPLGVARAALDHVRGIARHRVERQSKTPWPESYRVQVAIAEAALELSAARHAVYASLEAQWDRLTKGESPLPDERAAVVLARFGAFRAARAVVTRLYDLVGGSAIYRERSPMDRLLRDITTMSQHVEAQETTLQACGQLLLGQRPGHPFI